MNMGDPDTWQRFKAVIGVEPYKRHLESGTLGLTFARFVGAVVQLPAQLAVTLIAAVWGWRELVLGAREERIKPPR